MVLSTILSFSGSAKCAAIVSSPRMWVSGIKAVFEGGGEEKKRKANIYLSLHLGVDMLHAEPTTSSSDHT